jgi:hypothetical protein
MPLKALVFHTLWTIPVPSLQVRGFLNIGRIPPSLPLEEGNKYQLISFVGKTWNKMN